MSHRYTQIKVKAELTWQTVTSIHTRETNTGKAVELQVSWQSRLICAAGIIGVVGIGAYNDLLLGRPGAYGRGDRWIGVMQSLCAAAHLLWFHHKDNSEQSEGQ